jgi:hypothetical protein
MFAPPKMPGSNMGKSVLLYDDSAAASASSGLGSSLSSSSLNSDSVLNMDFMQKQQLQKRLIINEDVSSLATPSAIQHLKTKFIPISNEQTGIIFTRSGQCHANS